MYRVTRFTLLLAGLTLILAAACTPTTKLKSGSYSESLEGAEAAEITIDMPFEALEISLLDETSDNLIEADVQYIGEFDFEVSGSSTRTVRLYEDTNNLSYTGNDDPRWQVRLHPDVVYTLTLDISSGSAEANLVDLTLEGLAVQLSSGEVDVKLPRSESAYSLSIDVSSGTVNVAVPDDTTLDFHTLDLSSGDIMITTGENVAFDLNAEVSSGTVRLDVAEDQAIRLAADVSSGSVDVPSGFTLIGVEDDDPDGVYESPGYDEADAPIVIELNMSSGVFSIE